MKLNMQMKIMAGFILLCSIMSAGITFVITNHHYAIKYGSETTLRKDFDSLMLIVAFKKGELKGVRCAFDSVVSISKRQSEVLDSLLINKEFKKAQNEKKYRSIGSMSDDTLNSILSNKLN